MRIILYTGKGGVGKTSIATASAIKLALDGKKVLILSTDQAHSLGDSFHVTLTNEPKKILDGLYAMEIDTVVENEKAWGKLKEYLKHILVSKSQDSIEVEELLVFPGLDELFSLLKVKEMYEKKEYDALIVDCAPTGETLSLLKYPEQMQWWMEKFLPIKRKMTKVAGPLVEKTTKIPMPKDDVFDEIEYLYQKLVELHQLLTDKTIVSLRIVTTPEKIVVKEAKRNFAFLHLFDYNVDAIIVNKVYPKEAMEGYFSKWLSNQEESLKKIRESFCPVPIVYQELQPQELRTMNRLKKVATNLYGELDPYEVLFEEEIFGIEKHENCYHFKIKLPFVDKQELDILQQGDEIMISIKNEKRSFMLPNYLINKEIETATYDNNYLDLKFV